MAAVSPVAIDGSTEAGEAASSEFAPKGYWDLVSHQFFRNRVASVSLYIICFLLLLAAWAPVLANGKPFVWTWNGTTTYPLFQYLIAPSQNFSIDYLFNYLLFASLSIPFMLLVEKFSRNAVANRSAEQIRAGKRRRWMFALIGFALPIVLFVEIPGRNSTGGFSEFHVLRKWRNDATDYPRLWAESHKSQPNSYALFPPVAQDPITPTPLLLAAPNFESGHWLGTDKDGRDVLARMLHGARISLSVGFVAVGISTLLGILLGALAGYYRGWVDIAISRFIEGMICFPTFFLILTIIAFIDPAKRSIFHIMLVLGATGWTGIARLVRGEFLKLIDQDFVQSARALGCSNTRLMFKHMLPNAMGPVLVSAAFAVAGAILTESGLSFLGFGAPIPTPTWGEMISQGKEHLDEAWWLLFFPGMSIFLTVTIYNLAGDGLRDAMDPKLRK